MADQRVARTAEALVLALHQAGLSEDPRDILGRTFIFYDTTCDTDDNELVLIAFTGKVKNLQLVGESIHLFVDVDELVSPGDDRPCQLYYLYYGVSTKKWFGYTDIDWDPEGQIVLIG